VETITISVKKATIKQAGNSDQQSQSFNVLLKVKEFTSWEGGLRRLVEYDQVLGGSGSLADSLAPEVG